MAVIADTVRPSPADPGRETQPLKTTSGRNGTRACQPRSEAAVGAHAGVRIAAVMLLSLFLLACAAAAPHIGKTARPDNRILTADLPGGDSTWRGKDIAIVYKAATAGPDLEISGFIEFSSNLAKYPGVNYFRVYLHFLDTDGLVLDSKLLWAPGGQRDSRFIRWTFQRQWPMPPGTAALGFSYRGSVSEPGGDGSFSSTKTGWEVYQSP